MKNILSVCVFIIFSICLTSCAVENNPNIEGGTEMSRNLNSLEKGDIQNATISNEPPPKYDAKYFTNVDDLVQWILTEDIDAFQEGRYKDSISLLREHGEILVPSYTNSNMDLRFVEISPGYNELPTIVYFYQEGIVVTVKGVNEAYDEQANEEGIRNYLAGRYNDNTFKKEKVFETEIDTKDKRSEMKGKRKIEYVKTVDAEVSGTSYSHISFLSDEYDVRITKNQEVIEDRFLNELVLETVSLSE